MSSFTMNDLYEVLINELFDYIKTKGNEGMAKFLENEINTSKIAILMDIVSRAGVKKEFKTYQDCVKDFLTDLEILISNKINVTGSDGDFLRLYGILCAFLCIFEDKDETIFDNFNMDQFQKTFEIMKKLTDINKLANIYLNKFEGFKKEILKKNVDNLYQRWFKILYDQNLDSIKTKKKKNKKKKNDKKNTEDVKKENIIKNEDDEKEINDNSKVNSEKINENGNNESTNENGNSINDINIDVGEDSNSNDIQLTMPKEQNVQINEKNDAIDNLINQLESNQSTFSKNEELLFNILKQVRKELTEVRKEFKERVSRLEKHQLLLTHQVALYQNSRDMSKTIFLYLYKYFELKGDEALFDKTKKVFEYLNKKGDTNKLTEHKKSVLNKFLKTLYFINLYHNNILHRQLKTSTIDLIKNIQKNDKDSAIFPDFDYSQFISSIKYFIENLTSNNVIQEVLKDTYEKYSCDHDLGPIFDEEQIAVTLENQAISFKIEKNELEEAIDIMDKIKIKDDTLENLCNLNSWGKDY